ncbi:MAG: GIY-YIG nuclease family protein [Ignavibacteriales bacterium]|nr:MAG: GIY-YIG nuclease family protein [Ignavibacteriales bacterium]
MGYIVYILKSEITNRYYIGQTFNIEKRITLHNSPRARWTKRFQPWVLKYFEEYQTRSEVIKRERYLKSLKNIEFFLNSVG